MATSYLQGALNHTAISSWWGGVGLVWSRKQPALAAAFIFDVDRKGKTSDGWLFSVRLAAGGTLLLSKSFIPVL